MPVSFSRLRIAGFKSFAEPAHVEIRPGLTGIVGPNGCGKSNVVEALRWAMGENSARSLRGGEMDDVIFAGTAGAAVAQHRRGDADAGRHRRRRAAAVPRAAGAGDHPPHRARHRQLVPRQRHTRPGRATCRRCSPTSRPARTPRRWSARAASAALVTAKPDERRILLEEAAGITGLHARRHEAELKLRAAEANLTRAEDLRGQLEAQLAALKRQARQASRYRNISGAIRAAEAELLAIQRAEAERTRAAAQAALHAAGARGRRGHHRRHRGAGACRRGAGGAARAARSRGRGAHRAGAAPRRAGAACRGRNPRPRCAGRGDPSAGAAWPGPWPRHAASRRRRGGGGAAGDRGRGAGGGRGRARRQGRGRRAGSRGCRRSRAVGGSGGQPRHRGGRRRCGARPVARADAGPGRAAHPPRHRRAGPAVRRSTTAWRPRRSRRTPWPQRTPRRPPPRPR